MEFVEEEILVLSGLGEARVLEGPKPACSRVRWEAVLSLSVSATRRDRPLLTSDVARCPYGFGCVAIPTARRGQAVADFARSLVGFP